MSVRDEEHDDRHRVVAGVTGRSREGWMGRGLPVIEKVRDTIAAVDLSPESDQPEGTPLENCDQAPALMPLVHGSGS